MYFWILLIGFFYSCVPRPAMDVVLPPTKNIRSDLNKETIYTLGYMSEYEIWDFLKESPSEKDVLETFGLPDSVWLDDRELTKFLYYYISNIQDYNAIEISAKTDSVTGFEWD